MIHLLAPLAGVLFAVFVLGVIGAVMYYSYNALGLIFPGDLLGQLFGMLLFDVAVINWFLVFIKKCESTMQYVFSALGFLLGLGGTLGLVGIEIGISSGWLDPAEMARPLSYIFVLAMIGHLILIYAHHVSAPSISAAISMGVHRAFILGDAEKQAQRLVAENQSAIAGPLADEHVKTLLRQLDLQPRSGEVLDLQAVDLAQPGEEKSAGAVPGFLSRILSGLGSGGRKFESSVPSVVTTSQPQTPKPSPAPGDAGRDDGGDSAPA